MFKNYKENKYPPCNALGNQNLETLTLLEH